MLPRVRDQPMRREDEAAGTWECVCMSDKLGIKDVCSVAQSTYSINVF